MNKVQKDVIAHQYLYNKIYDVQMSDEISGNILPQKLIIKPGKYKVFDKVYDMSREGLYRFIQPFDKTEQRIVCTGGGYKKIGILLSSTSWILAHGTLDDRITIEKENRKALHRKLICSCSYASSWVSSVLKKFNINSRLVVGLTLDKWNSYDNGHTMLEIFTGNRWVVYDVTNHMFFKNELHYLDMYELCDIVFSHRDYEIISLTDSLQYDVNSPCTLWTESKMSNKECLKKCYDRLFQCSLIEQNNKFYFCDVMNKDKVESYSHNYKYMEKDKFMEEFYYVSNKGD